MSGTARMSPDVTSAKVAILGRGESWRPGCARTTEEAAMATFSDPSLGAADGITAVKFSPGSSGSLPFYNPVGWFTDIEYVLEERLFNTFDKDPVPSRDTRRRTRTHTGRTRQPSGAPSEIAKKECEVIDN